MSDQQEYLQFATKLAHQAGEIMLQHFQIGIAKEDKADGSPVTIADKKINQLVIDEIAKNYPDHAVLGEEASAPKDGAAYVWVCDPIDGTTPYTLGIPINQFSLALVKNGEPILGVLYDPYMKRLYQAVKGKGTFLNNQRIQVSKQTTLSGNFIATPTITALFFDSAALMQRVMKQKINVICFFCCTYEAVQVATGQFVGNIYGYQNAHDVAAVKIIVEEAGGKVTDLSGNEQRYDQPINGAIVSNGVVHDELLVLVKPFLTTP